MYKWHVDVILKGSGEKLELIYESALTNSGDVAKILFHGKGPNDWVGFYGKGKKSNVLVVCGEIAAVDIYPF